MSLFFIKEMNVKENILKEQKDLKIREIMSVMWLKFEKIYKTADYHCTAFVFC